MQIKNLQSYLSSVKRFLHHFFEFLQFYVSGLLKVTKAARVIDKPKLELEVRLSG